MGPYPIILIGKAKKDSMPYPCYSSGPLLFYGIGVVRASRGPLQ